MAKKAKKKSGVSRAARTVKKAASSAARSTRKAVKKMMPRKKAKKKIFTALIEQLNDQTPGIILRAQNLWRAAASRPSKEFAGRDDLTASP
jgi:hypothetical protein